MASTSPPPRLPELLEHVHGQLLPELRIHCPDPHDPVKVLHLPAGWQTLGCGNYAAVLHHPQHPDLVVKVYGPARPGLEQEAEVYRRIGRHRAFSQCFHAGQGFLVLRRLQGTTLYDCLRRGSARRAEFWWACSQAGTPLERQFPCSQCISNALQIGVAEIVAVEQQRHLQLHVALG